METNQWIWAYWGGRWCISAKMTVTWKTSHILDSHAQLSHHEMKAILISSSTWIGRLQPRNWVWNWIFASMHWKWWWQYWNIAMFAPGTPLSAHTRTERTPYASFSESIEQHVSSSSKKMFKTKPWEGKAMCTVFWDRKGVILLDFLEPGPSTLTTCWLS